MPSIEGIIRQAMSDDTGGALDTYLIDNVAASAGVRPAGLLNGVTPITASVLTAGTFRNDRRPQGTGRRHHGGRRRRDEGPIAVLINPAQALRLELCARPRPATSCSRTRRRLPPKFGVRFIVSATVPAGKGDRGRCGRLCNCLGRYPALCGVDRGNAARGGHGALALGTGAQGSGVLAVPMRSLFQTDAVAIRMSLYVSWVMRRALMVQTIAAVTW